MNAFKNTPLCNHLPAVLTASLLLAILLGGCGQSGPLYLPDEDQPADTTVEQADDPSEDEDAENTGT
jgi:predicted small lipoprotein YifL